MTIRTLAFWTTLAVLLLAAPTTAKPPLWDKRIEGKGRFKVLKAFDGEAVLDKETGLVWERAPVDVLFTWATHACNLRIIGGRRGWRRPTIPELQSLTEPSTQSLPEGHPFEGVPLETFWSATTTREDPGLALVVEMSTGSMLARDKTATEHVWCVRGPGGEGG